MAKKASPGRISFKSAGATRAPSYQGRKLRSNLTADERKRLDKYGAVGFKSAGATRKP